jgi:hypothetical protein
VGEVTLKTFAEYFNKLKPQKLSKDEPYVIILSMTDWQEAKQILNSDRGGVCPLCTNLDKLYRANLRRIFNEQQKNGFVDISEALSLVYKAIDEVKV